MTRHSIIEQQLTLEEKIKNMVASFQRWKLIRQYFRLSNLLIDLKTAKLALPKVKPEHVETYWLEEAKADREFADVALKQASKKRGKYEKHTYVRRINQADFNQA